MALFMPNLAWPRAGTSLPFGACVYNTTPFKDQCNASQSAYFSVILQAFLHNTEQH